MPICRELRWQIFISIVPYTTVMQVRWMLCMLLPILTVKGNRFCNRVGESFCENLDLQEMICKDLKKYEEKAIELALRPSKLLPLEKDSGECGCRSFAY